MLDPVKHNLRTVNCTGVAAVLLLVLGTLVLGVYPMYRDGQDKIRATGKTAEARDRIEALRPEVKAARDELQAAQARLANAEKSIPQGPPDNEFSRELNEVAKAAGVRVESTPPMGRPLFDGAYHAVQVSVDGSGDWESCMRFLRGISAMNRTARLDTVVLDTERDGLALGTANPVCRLQVKFSAFYRE